MYTKRIYYFEELLGKVIHLSCNHPFISKIESVKVDRRTLALSMKYIRRTLLNVVGSKRMMYQLVQAVKYLHDNGMVHCDIKASNVLVDDDDNILLTDFGIATYAGYSMHIGWDNGCSHILESDLKFDHIGTYIDIYALGKLFRSSFREEDLNEFEKEAFQELTHAMLRTDVDKRCDINFVLEHPFFYDEYLSRKDHGVNPLVFNSLSDKNRGGSSIYADQLLKGINRDYPNSAVYKLTRELFINSKYESTEAKGVMNACKMLAGQLFDYNPPYDGELGLLYVDRVLNALFDLTLGA